jgi:hypothetical protein
VVIVAGAYDVFADRAASGLDSRSKQDRVRDCVLRHGPETFRMAEIRAALPGVSDRTIRVVFDQLKADGVIAVDGPGRSETWHRLR